MNYIIAGTVHAVMDPSHVVSFLSAFYIPPIDPNTIKKKKEICASLKDGLQSRVLLCTTGSHRVRSKSTQGYSLAAYMYSVAINQVIISGYNTGLKSNTMMVLRGIPETH